MSQYDNSGFDDETDEVQGPERYLQPGEALLIFSTDVQIKKFRFEAFLTDKRLFLVDLNEKKPGVTAKEIPVDSIVDAYLEQSQSQEPILVFTIRTSDEDVRTMKMVFAHTGDDRLSQAEEWVHLIQHGPHGREQAPPCTGPGEEMNIPARETPVTAPEARSLSETIVFPVARQSTPAAPAEPSTPAAEPQTVVRDVPAYAKRPAPAPAFSGVTEIQFCFHCGKKLPPNANFCPFCGTRMHQVHTPDKIPAPAPAPKPRTQPRTEPEPVQTPEKKEKKGGFRFFKR
jgi:ribosomal protein L40E